MKRLIVLTMLFVQAFVFCGCRDVREIVREVPMHDTLYSEHWQIDTVYMERWHTIDRKGDTVWHNDSVVVYKAKYIRDTLREVEDVPVEVVRTETVEVEKPLTGWQKLLMWIGGIGLIGGMCWLLWKTRGAWGKRIKV